MPPTSIKRAAQDKKDRKIFKRIKDDLSQFADDDVRSTLIVLTWSKSCSKQANLDEFLSNRLSIKQDKPSLASLTIEQQAIVYEQAKLLQQMLELPLPPANYNEQKPTIEHLERLVFGNSVEPGIDPRDAYKALDKTDISVAEKLVIRLRFLALSCYRYSRNLSSRDLYFEFLLLVTLRNTVHKGWLLKNRDNKTICAYVNYMSARNWHYVAEKVQKYVWRQADAKNTITRETQGDNGHTNYIPQEYQHWQNLPKVPRPTRRLPDKTPDSQTVATAGETATSVTNSTLQTTLSTPTKPRDNQVRVSPDGRMLTPIQAQHDVDRSQLTLFEEENLPSPSGNAANPIILDTQSTTNRAGDGPSAATSSRPRSSDGETIEELEERMKRQNEALSSTRQALVTRLQQDQASNQSSLSKPTILRRIKPNWPRVQQKRRRLGRSNENTTVESEN